MAAGVVSWFQFFPGSSLRRTYWGFGARACGALTSAVLLACTPEPEPDGRDEDVLYRTGTEEDGYRSSGERGNVTFSEIHWAGSIRGDGDEYDPDDDFIELQNKHPRPMHLTGWILSVEIGWLLDSLATPPSDNEDVRQFVIPPRENGLEVQPNEYVVIAAQRDGAFPDADYFIEDLRLPNAPFAVELTDSDERLMDGGGDARKTPFAGGYDLVTVRSMERVQLVFNNDGKRDYAWHSYSLNDFDEGEEGAYHEELRRFVDPDYQARTFATPRSANSPDYSGNVSSGNVD